MKLAPGIHRIGDGLVNSYLLAEGGEVTIVDEGLCQPIWPRAVPLCAWHAPRDPPSGTQRRQRGAARLGPRHAFRRRCVRDVQRPVGRDWSPALPVWV